MSNVRYRLYVRDDCLLIDDRICLPTQFRQTVLDGLHLTQPGSAAMLDLYQHIWFPHIHSAIVQMAQGCRQCTEQGKNLKPVICKQHSLQMEPVVDPNKKIQLDFAGPLPDHLNKNAYVLVTRDKCQSFTRLK